MEVVGLRKREKNFFLTLVVFFEKQKENKVCVQAIAYIAISCNGLSHIMKGAGSVRFLDKWNTDCFGSFAFNFLEGVFHMDFFLLHCIRSSGNDIR